MSFTLSHNIKTTFLVLIFWSQPSFASENTWEVIYQVMIPAAPVGSDQIEIFAPIATSDQHQDVTRFKVDATHAWLPASKVQKEKIYDNSFWHGKISPNGQPITLTFTYEVTRRENIANFSKARATPLTPQEQQEFALFLKANKRVPIDGKIINAIRKDMALDKKTPLEKARAIYNYVFDNMEYKKVGTGWGNGDTMWACSEKYGNCTDFHALFTSLARAEGISARFEIGLPVAGDSKEGDIKGYHCWVNFWIPGAGWIPADISEAKKNPKLKDYLFGSQPADRIKFSVGRDLVLSDDPNFKALNYFVYPVVLQAGRDVEKIETKFSFKAVPKVTHH